MTTKELTRSDKELVAAPGRHVIGFVLDRSGSMNSCLNSTIDGFNEWLATTAAAVPGAVTTLVLFDSDEVEVRAQGAAIGTVAPLSTRNYLPGAATPLYDAVGSTIRALEKEVTDEDKVLFVILTDGLENASREYTRESVFALIKEMDARGNWTFAFLGANQDAYAESAEVGIQRGRTVRFADSHQGKRAAFKSTASATERWASSPDKMAVEFFDEAERGEVEKWADDS
jgi:hypothetical protein